MKVFGQLLCRVTTAVSPEKFCRVLACYGDSLLVDFIDKYYKQNELKTDTQQCANLVKEILQKSKELLELEVLVNDTGNDSELRTLGLSEHSEASTEVNNLFASLKANLLPKDKYDSCDCTIQVSAAAGGAEAALFARELFHSYQSYASFRNFKTSNLQISGQPVHRQIGYKQASFDVSGDNVYRHFKFESGVHRVQRVPINAKIMHTSTVTLSVLPKDKITTENRVNPKDLEITAMRASGPGGQGINKSNSQAVVRYIPTGLIVRCQEQRTFLENKKIALRKLQDQLFNAEFSNHISSINSLRKLQIGTAERGEKIRTYHYPRNSVLDHRIGKSIHNLEEYFKGTHLLDEMITAVHCIDADDFFDKLYDAFIGSLKNRMF